MKLTLSAVKEREAKISLLIEQQNFEKARALLETSMEELGEHALFYKLKGYLSYMELSFEEALVAFDQCHSLAADDEEAGYCLAAILNDLGFYQKASLVLERLSSQARPLEGASLVQSRLDLAQGYFASGQKEEALNILRSLYFAQEGDLKVSLALANMLIDMENFDEAQTLLERESAGHYDNYDLNLLLGLVLYKKGQVQKASHLWAKAYAVHPRDPKGRVLSAFAARLS